VSALGSPLPPFARRKIRQALGVLVIEQEYWLLARYSSVRFLP